MSFSTSGLSIDINFTDHHNAGPQNPNTTTHNPHPYHSRGGKLVQFPAAAAATNIAPSRAPKEKKRHTEYAARHTRSPHRGSREKNHTEKTRPCSAKTAHGNHRSAHTIHGRSQASTSSSENVSSNRAPQITPFW